MKVALAAMAVLACQAMAQTPRTAERLAALPLDLVEVLDGAKFKIRVPANWNGTLLVYLQGTKVTPTPEHVVVPPVVAGSQPALEETLLARGYALAASDFGSMDMQTKEATQDSLALTAYFKGRVGEPKRVLLWGTSNGALVSLKMIEDYPRTFDGAVATCPPAAGFGRGMDRHLDFSVAYATAFGWPTDKLGPIDDLRPGLNFMTDVYPNVNLPKADGSNRAGWEFIRLGQGISSEAFWNTNPVYGQPGWIINLLMATVTRSLNQSYAAGPFTQNLDRQYSLLLDEKIYLKAMGVDPDALLVQMNSMRNITAAPYARDYAERYGSLRGLLRRPVITLHNTTDNVAEARQDSAYRAQVQWWGVSDKLVQTYVKNPGHCAFTSAQLLAALEAMERWLDTGIRPEASAFPVTLNFDNTFVPAPWPY